MGWLSYLYTVDDLTHKLQSFKNENSSQNLLRLVLLLINLGNVVFIVYIYNLHRLTMFFTNWTLVTTAIYLGVAIAASRYKTLKLLAWHHLLFEVSFIMNIVVVTVYWSMLHKESLADCQNDPYKIVNVYWAHIMPGFSIAANFAMTDVVIRGSHYKGLVVIAALYGYVNYKETKARNKPLYHFLHWNDYTTVLIYSGLVAGFAFLFTALSSVTVTLKRGKN